eukprot:7751230-Pyramimonas_sp.AAC.1
MLEIANGQAHGRSTRPIKRATGQGRAVYEPAEQGFSWRAKIAGRRAAWCRCCGRERLQQHGRIV